MSTATQSAPVRNPIQYSDIRRAVMEDDSPFGVQGLTRDKLKILKPDCIGQFAAVLALRGTPDQIRDPDFVARVLSYREDWQQEYQVIHLIERSLWIDGHSDLVMTVLQNPSQIPDDPPPAILRALSRAIDYHPQSTVWYGVPLFGEETNADGLPIPLTAAEVRDEAASRIAMAQQSALRWRWAYRAAYRLAVVPKGIWNFARRCGWQMIHTAEGCRKYWQRVKRDARNRNRAKIVAHSEYCRMGQCFTRIPEHTTTLGLVAEQTASSFEAAQELISDRLPSVEGAMPFAAGAIPPVVHGIMLSSLAPLFFMPMTVVACDPFLFVELPDEPGKLRFLGHWYWQGPVRGKQKLHLHV